MRKQGFICTLFIITIALILASCGGKEGASKRGSSQSSGPVVVDADGKVNGLVYKEGLPIVDPGTYSFSLLTDATKSSEEFYLLPLFEDQTGIEVEILDYPHEVAREKYSLALNSGDYADCIGGWLISKADILKFGMEMGIYIPLEDLIAEYAPNIEMLLEMEGVRETMTAPDGHIYSIPYVIDAPVVDFSPFINMEWLQRVGMDVPTTTEELKKVLMAFKQQDANGNGNPNDEIPFSLLPNNKHFGYYAGWFGLPLDDDGFTMVDGELTFAADSEAYKSMILYFRDLYTSGLLDPEIFTIDTNQWKAKGSNDVYGVAHMYGSQYVMPTALGEESAWLPLPVLAGPGVTDPKWMRDTNGRWVLNRQMVITDKAEHPEAIIRWWNNVYEFENSIQTKGGPIGIKLFEDEETGEWWIKEDLSEEENVLYNEFNLYPAALPRYIPLGFKFQGARPDEKELVAEVYEPFLTEESVPTYWVQADISSELGDIASAIRTYIDQKTAAWISNQASIEDEWETYKKQLDKFGLQRYIQIRKEAIGQ